MDPRMLQPNFGSLSSIATITNRTSATAIVTPQASPTYRLRRRACLAPDGPKSLTLFKAPGSGNSGLVNAAFEGIHHPTDSGIDGSAGGRSRADENGPSDAPVDQAGE